MTKGILGLIERPLGITPLRKIKGQSSNLEETYTYEQAKIDIMNSPFAEALGWVEDGELTEAGKEAAREAAGQKRTVSSGRMRREERPRSRSVR